MSKYLHLRAAWSGLDQEFITGQLKEKRELGGSGGSEAFSKCKGEGGWKGKVSVLPSTSPDQRDMCAEEEVKCASSSVSCVSSVFMCFADIGFSVFLSSYDAPKFKSIQKGDFFWTFNFSFCRTKVIHSL